MRRYFTAVMRVSSLFAFLALFVWGCGGGGEDGAGSPTGTLTGISINGPSSVTEYGTGAYTATASWSDNSTSVVTPNWSVDPQVATIKPNGVLTCSQMDSDQTVTITATYSSGGITETAAMDVTLINAVPIPFASGMLSGKVFFQEIPLPGGGWESYLSDFRADFSFVQDRSVSSGGSERKSGTWSVDASGNLIVSLQGQGPVTVMLLSDASTYMEVVVDDGIGPPTIEFLEKTVPIDPAQLPGSYLSQNGSLWTFNSNGTGSTTGGGGWTFTWSVDSGILKNVFSSGYAGWFHARASSQGTSSAYTLLRVGFVEYSPSGGFYNYYGGRDLTRQ